MADYNVNGARADLTTTWSNGVSCTVQFGI
jgi:hypothetical protein